MTKATMHKLSKLCMVKKKNKNFWIDLSWQYCGALSASYHHLDLLFFPAILPPFPAH